MLAGKPRLTQRSQLSKSSTQSYACPGTQPLRPASNSSIASGVRSGSCPSAGDTSIEVIFAQSVSRNHCSSPVVPPAPMPVSLAWVKRPSLPRAASSRRANSSSVTQNRSPYCSGRWNRMRPLLIGSMGKVPVKS